MLPRKTRIYAHPNSSGRANRLEDRTSALLRFAPAPSFHPAAATGELSFKSVASPMAPTGRGGRGRGWACQARSLLQILFVAVILSVLRLAAAWIWTYTERKNGKVFQKIVPSFVKINFPFNSTNQCKLKIVELVMSYTLISSCRP